MSERDRGKPIRDAWQRHVGNRVIRQLLEIGIAPQVYALLETTGRTTGQRRRTPIGNGLEAGSNTFWLISEHGIRAGYVRNIQANPRVRVKIGRRWRTGTAHICERTTRSNASARRAVSTPAPCASGVTRTSFGPYESTSTQ